MHYRVEGHLSTSAHQKVLNQQWWTEFGYYRFLWSRYFEMTFDLLSGNMLAQNIFSPWLCMYSAWKSKKCLPCQQQCSNATRKFYFRNAHQVYFCSRYLTCSRILANLFIRLPLPRNSLGSVDFLFCTLTNI